MDAERAVRERYSGGAKSCDSGLCCPVSYDATYLEAIPAEVIEKDYGCGDPTAHLNAGERVLDLGAGGGKACFIASQVVGADGSVIGVDMNDDMLALAKKHAPEVARRIGYANVDFRKGKIQDLAPIVDDGCVDVVISNCVLNLVRPQDKAHLFEEIHRVLAAGGRAVISDIVCDRDVPRHLQDDPELFSGCISGAFREDQFVEAFKAAGFERVELVERVEEPWRTVEGIEFRSVTLRAEKAGKTAGCGSPSNGCC